MLVELKFTNNGKEESVWIDPARVTHLKRWTHIEVTGVGAKTFGTAIYVDTGLDGVVYVPGCDPDFVARWVNRKRAELKVVQSG